MAENPLDSGINAAPASRYVVGRELGRGGMGIVYEAEDGRLGCRVAIVFLQTGPENPERKRRFAQEARAASALKHPNIITIHDIDTTDDGDFIVMELVDGVPLSASVARWTDGDRSRDRLRDSDRRRACGLTCRRHRHRDPSRPT